MSEITLPVPDSTGDKVATETFQEGADTLHMQKVILGDEHGGNGITELLASLNQIKYAIESLANPLWLAPTIGALNVYPSGGSLTTVTTVSNLNGLGGISPVSMPLDAMATAWATSIRPCIT